MTNHGDQFNKSIAVVGGGLSGLSIASGLIKKGYGHVTLFESSHRLGGKLFTVDYKGKTYELGALFALPSQKNMKALLKASHIKADGPKLSRIYYKRNGQRMLQMSKSELDQFVEQLKRLPEVLAKYPSLLQTDMALTEDDLKKPFAPWCQHHGLSIVLRIYAQYFTSFGLGDVAVIPAIYVLRVITYDIFMSFMDLPEFSTWRDGVETIVQSLEANIGDVRLNQPVEIMPSESGVCVKTPYESLLFDCVILTAPLNQFSSFYSGNPEMCRLLQSIQYQTFRVYLFAVENLPKGCGCLLENLSLTHSGHMMLWNNRWEDSESGLLTLYAYHDGRKTPEESLKSIVEDLKRFGVNEPKLYQLKEWQQSPFVTSDILESGFYQSLQDEQGRNGIYFAGEIMSTISMENALAFSKHLLDTYF